jgi:hypothetical protein
MRMALKISSLTASVVMFALGSTLPAQAQFMTSFPAIIIVPPPTQNYAVAKPTDRSTAPDKLKASVDTPALVQTSIYQGHRRSLDHCGPRETSRSTGQPAAASNPQLQRPRSLSQWPLQVDSRHRLDVSIA